MNTFVVGADLGQATDPSAIAVVERITAPTAAPVLAVRHLERLPLGTPYPKVAARLVALFDREPLSGGTLVVDETGVGRPVVDLLRTQPIKATVCPLTITSGSRARVDEGGRWRVAKKLLVANVRSLIGSGRLKVADGLPDAGVLLRELADFRVTVTSKANETFGAGSHGAHDDLVLAVALAVWPNWGGRGAFPIQAAAIRICSGFSCHAHI
jgi:hypothetical protein